MTNLQKNIKKDKRDVVNVYVNYGDTKSIDKAEVKQEKLINKGYNTYKTEQVGFDRYILKYKKSKRRKPTYVGGNEVSGYKNFYE